MNFGQYLLFLMRALANTPFLHSSLIPFNTQKPLSRITMNPFKNIEQVAVTTIQQLPQDHHMFAVPYDMDNPFPP